jgi:hypothetical protein
MTDADLVRIGLALAESLDKRSAPSAAGVVRQLARRVLELAAAEWPDDARRCEVCGVELPPSARSDAKTCSARCRMRRSRNSRG